MIEETKSFKKLIEDVENLKEEAIQFLRTVPVVEVPCIEPTKLVWETNDLINEKSQLILNKYEVWFNQVFPLIEKYIPYQKEIFLHCYNSPYRHPYTSIYLILRFEASVYRKDKSDVIEAFDKTISEQKRILSIILQRAETQGDSIDENNFPEVNQILVKINSELNKIVPASEHQDRASFNRVFKTILKYAAYNLKFIEFPNASFDEKDFQRKISQWVFHEFGRKSDEQVKTGRGFVDLRIDSIPIELKIDKDECNSLKLINKHLSQVCAYTNSERQRAGILAILSLMRSNLPDPNLINDVLIKTCQTKGSPSKPEKYPTVILTIVFRGNQRQPSRFNS